MAAREKESMPPFAHSVEQFPLLSESLDSDRHSIHPTSPPILTRQNQSIAVQESSHPPEFFDKHLPSSDRASSSIDHSKLHHSNTSLPHRPLIRQPSSRVLDHSSDRQSSSSFSFGEDSEADSWTIVDPAALNPPSTPSPIHPDQPAESVGASLLLGGESTQRLSDIVEFSFLHPSQGSSHSDLQQDLVPSTTPIIHRNLATQSADKSLPSTQLSPDHSDSASLDLPPLHNKLQPPTHLTSANSAPEPPSKSEPVQSVDSFSPAEVAPSEQSRFPSSSVSLAQSIHRRLSDSTAHSPGLPSSLSDQDQAAESIKLHPHSPGFSQITLPQRDPPLSSLISHTDARSQAEQAFRTAQHHPISTVHSATHSSLSFEQPQSPASVPHHLSSRDSKLISTQGFASSLSASRSTPGLPSEQDSSTAVEHRSQTANDSHHLSPTTSSRPEITATVPRQLPDSDPVETPDRSRAAEILRQSPSITHDSDESSGDISSKDLELDYDFRPSPEPSLHDISSSEDSSEGEEGLQRAYELGRQAGIRRRRAEKRRANIRKRQRLESSPPLQEEMPDHHNPQWVKERLEVHNMYQDLGAKLDVFPKFKARVHRVISRQRVSAATHQEFLNFRKKLEFYQNQNEDTLLAMLLPAIIKENRTVLVPSSDYSQGQIEDSIQFFDSGVVCIVNREFKKGYLPYRQGLSFIDHDLVEAMTKMKEQGMSNPKPDRTYGLRRDRYEFPASVQMPEKIKEYLEILHDLHLPFLIIEGKSGEGSAPESRNQGCRGGACLNHHHRILRAELGFKDKRSGPDTHTFVFSGTCTDNQLNVWVHWVELRKDGPPIFRMSLLESLALLNEEHFRRARMVMHNILEWGCGPRYKGLLELYKKITKYAGGEEEQEEGTEEGEEMVEDDEEESDEEEDEETDDEEEDDGHKGKGPAKKQKTAHS